MPKNVLKIYKNVTSYAVANLLFTEAAKCNPLNFIKLMSGADNSQFSSLARFGTRCGEFSSIYKLKG